MMIKKIITLFIMMFFLYPNVALAEAWWGDGTKPHKWILNHGGTIIKFEIENYNGSRKEYKVVMYDKKGKYVEAEWGVQGTFDDAKDGVYTIKAKRGETIDFGVKKNRKEGKTFATIKLTAHPGETIKIKFNYKKKSAKITTDYVAPVAKAPAKPAPVYQTEPPVVENVQEETEEPLSVYNYAPEKKAVPFYIYKDEKNKFFNFAEDFVHPDVSAEENEQPMIIKPSEEGSGSDSEKNNFWEKITQIISSWLRSVSSLI